MNTVGGRETGTQARVLTFFQKALGYTYLGNWQTRQGNSNIEKEMLADWLRSSGHADPIITKVLFELEKTAALAIDTTIRRTKQDDWRGNRRKKRQVQNAIARVIQQEFSDYDLDVNVLLELAVNQSEY